MGVNRGHAQIVLLAAVLFAVLSAAPAAAADHWTDISDAAWQTVYGVDADDAAALADGFPHGDGTYFFGPALDVTRGQFAKLTTRGAGLSPQTPGTATFADVPGGSTFFGYVEAAYRAELIKGAGDGLFHPGDAIARQQANTILGRYMAGEEYAARGYIKGQLGTHYNTVAAWYAAEGPFYLGAFSDRSRLTPVHAPYTAYLVARGVVQGSADLRLNPTDDISRAQAVVQIIRTARALEQLLAKPPAPVGLATTPVSPTPSLAPFVSGLTIAHGRVEVFAELGGDVSLVAQTLADAGGYFSVRVFLDSEGEYELTARVRNAEGPVSDSSEPLPYVADATPPDGALLEPAEGGAVRTSKPPFSVAAGDEGSGMAQVVFRYRRVGGLAYTTVSADPSAPYQAEWGTLALPVDAQYELAASLYDEAGNERMLGPMTLLLDTAGPLASIGSPRAPGPFYTEDPRLPFLVAANDPPPPNGEPESSVGSVVFLYHPRAMLPLDPAEWAAQQFTLLSSDESPDYAADWGAIELPDDEYVFAAEAVDRAGNRSPLATQRVVLDRAAPTGGFTIALGGQVLNAGDEILLTWQVADPSGVGSLTLEFSATGAEPWTELPLADRDAGSLSWTVPEVPPPADACLLRLTAVDLTGPAVEDVPGHTLVDETGPFTITLPEALGGPQP